MDAGKLKAIIRLCQKEGITSYKCDGIELVFGAIPQKASGKELDPQDVAQLKEDAMAESLITDPVAYEQMLMDAN